MQPDRRREKERHHDHQRHHDGAGVDLVLLQDLLDGAVGEHQAVDEPAGQVQTDHGDQRRSEEPGKTGTPPTEVAGNTLTYHHGCADQHAGDLVGRRQVALRDLVLQVVPLTPVSQNLTELKAGDPFVNEHEHPHDQQQAEHSEDYRAFHTL